MPWLRWLFAAFAVAFPVIFASHLLRQRPVAHAVSEALIWGAITAFVFMAAKIRNARRGRRCALCEPGNSGVRG